MIIRTLLAVFLASATTMTARSDDRPLIQSILKQTLWSNRDGQGIAWFHPRVCMMPDPDGKPMALMTLQEIGGSDYFGQVHWSTSTDLGATWSEPVPIDALGREPVEGHEGLTAGVCDVVPQYHAPSDTVLAMGHVVFYRGPTFARGDQLSRYPVYTVRRKDGTWSQRRILKWDDPRTGTIYSNNCGQRIVMPGGNIMMSLTFGSEVTNRMVAGVRCTYDGTSLRIAEVGPPLHNEVGRGLLEPSLTRFNNMFYLTMRAEDGHGYVAVSDDGIHYRRKTAWAWDDGAPITMSTTQQHWLPHSDGLFLVYTRKDESNANVIRWRSPLWVARVDPERLCLLRATERAVLPLVG
ncbi:MAG: sialidase family protein, partial [Pirellulales bacterium]